MTQASRKKKAKIISNYFKRNKPKDEEELEEENEENGDKEGGILDSLFGKRKKKLTAGSKGRKKKFSGLIGG